MNLPRLTAYLSSSAMLASALFVYAEHVYLLGFPDGFVSELDRAERRLAVVVIVASLSMGSYLLRLGYLAARQAIGKRLLVALALYLLIWLAVLCLDHHARSYLPGGGGG